MSNDKMEIRTNGHFYRTIGWHELTAKERKDFDYKDTEDKQNEAVFVRYKGVVYDLEDFMFIDKRVAPHPQRPGWEKWHGYSCDSFFSGVLVRWCDTSRCHDDHVQMATYFC